MTVASVLPFDLAHSLHPNLLLLLGIAIFGGSMGAGIFRRLHIPQVVGYIVIGLILGESGVGLFGHDTIESLRLFNFFALGIIGFMVGGELRREVFKKYGKQFVVILLSEGLSAFVFVGLATTLVAYAAFGDLQHALALGIVLGAISSATAPAATVDVLWEYKCAGPLTTTVLATVALDDGLALVLYAISLSVADALTGRASSGLGADLASLAYDLLGAVLVGCGAGALLNQLLRRIKDRGTSLAFTIGMVIATIGLTVMLNVDMILAAMCLGMTVANLAPRRSRGAFELVEGFAPPIYTLFFVLVGARLTIEHMTVWLWALAGAYVVARTLGKMIGANLGGRWSGAPQTVRRYLGLCLFSQAGVAIGLSILATQHFSADMAQTIITVITGTTLLVQVIGPPSVKAAVHKAGEAGMNVTVEDLIGTYRVADVMEKKPVALREETPLPEVMRVFSRHNFLSYPVVDAQDRVKGLISFEQIRDTLGAEALQHVLVAHDIMEPQAAVCVPGTPLQEALDQMQELGLEHMAVVSEADEGRLVGFLDRALLIRAITSEVVRRSEQARAHLT